MAEPRFIGLDVHKDIVVATTLGPSGPLLDQSRIEADPEAVGAYLRRQGGELHVTLEACPVWQPFYDAAVRAGAEVKLAHPAGVKWIAKAKKKNDKVDSEKLATLLRTGDIPEAFAPPPVQREMRRLARDWFFFHGKYVSIVNHTYGILLQKGVRYPEGILMLKRKREELREHRIPDVDRALDTLRSLDPVLLNLEHAIDATYDKSPEAQLLSSIPGVGRKVSLALAAYLVPIERFDNLDEVAAYCGVCPRTSQSSKRAWVGPLRTGSNHLLSGYLMQAYWMHRLRCGNSTITRAAKKKERKAGRKAGAIAGAHKLLDIACAILRRRTPYAPHAPERPSCIEPPAEPKGVATR